MKKSNLEKMSRKKLSEYTRYGDWLRSMYIIIFSIIWIVCIIWKSYSNWDYMTDKSSEILSLLPFLLFWCVFLWFWIYTLNKRIKEKKLKERLLLDGNKLIATVVDIKSVWIMLQSWDDVAMWRWSWFKIYAKHKDRVFISPKIWIKVPKYVEIWDKIPVFIDIQNPDEYYMDLDSINSN
jgi:hypothetical protein